MLVNHGTAGRRIQFQVTLRDQRGLRHEAAGEDDTVALQDVSGAVTFDLDRLDVRGPDDSNEARVGEHRDAEQGSSDEITWAGSTDAWALFQHRDRA